MRIAGSLTSPVGIESSLRIASQWTSGSAAKQLILAFAIIGCGTGEAGDGEEDSKTQVQLACVDRCVRLDQCDQLVPDTSLNACESICDSNAEIQQESPICSKELIDYYQCIAASTCDSFDMQPKIGSCGDEFLEVRRCTTRQLIEP